MSTPVSNRSSMSMGTSTSQGRSRRLSRRLESRASGGFTLIELLVVIAIIGVLVALILPAVQAARESARKAGCKNNLRQIGLAMHNYESSFGVVPPGYLYRYAPEGNEMGFGWAAMLLPYVEQGTLHRQVDFNRAIWDDKNAEPRMIRLPVYLCPSDGEALMRYVEMGEEPTLERYAISSYVANFGPPDLDENQEQPLGVFCRNSGTRLAEITDGLSFTLFVGERENGLFRNGATHGVHFEFETTWAGAVRQYDEPEDDHGHMILFQTGHSPNHPESDDRDVSSAHDGLVHFLMGDGSVRGLREAIDIEVYTALGTRDSNDTAE